jgi:hypothetical protein
MAGARARAGQLIGQAARAAKSARARPPASWIDPSAVAFQIMLCGRRKEKCMAARARAPASWSAGPSVYRGEYVHHLIYIYIIYIYIIYIYNGHISPTV